MMDPQDKLPNYVTNVDLKYPYSDLPYIGQYKLLKLPFTGKLIEHVDYWGEGSIVNGGLYSGFRNCYNVNRQYQEVSNGPDKGRKIPNRIPVRDENDCDTRAYIKDDSVKIVTLMSAPIIPNSARDITRIVNERVGMVVIYGMPVESQGIKLLAAELKSKLLLYCPDYELPDYLQEPTMMDSHVAFLNKQLLMDLLFKCVSTGDYDKAVTITKSLQDDNVGFMIEELIDRLLRAREPNVFAYADKLWSAGHHDIVNDFFPSEVKLITKQERVKIIGRYYNQALKLDSNVDSYNNRLAWGDSKDKTSHRVSWKFIPVWENNKLLYKILNTEYTMYLKLDMNVEEYGDRKAWGSNNSNEKGHLWKLTPVVLETGNVLLIENHEYGQSLKLDAHVDSYGDRRNRNKRVIMSVQRLPRTPLPLWAARYGNCGRGMFPTPSMDQKSCSLFCKYDSATVSTGIEEFDSCGGYRAPKKARPSVSPLYTTTKIRQQAARSSEGRGDMATGALLHE